MSQEFETQSKRALGWRRMINYLDSEGYALRGPAASLDQMCEEIFQTEGKKVKGNHFLTLAEKVRKVVGEDDLVQKQYDDRDFFSEKIKDMPDCKMLVLLWAMNLILKKKPKLQGEEMSQSEWVGLSKSRRDVIVENPPELAFWNFLGVWCQSWRVSISITLRDVLQQPQQFHLHAGLEPGKNPEDNEKSAFGLDGVHLTSPARGNAKYLDIRLQSQTGDVYASGLIQVGYSTNDRAKVYITEYGLGTLEKFLPMGQNVMIEDGAENEHILLRCIST
jgi:hypothetical protein